MLTLLLGLLLTTQQSDSTLFITNARLLNVRSGLADEGVSLLIRNGRVAARGPAANAPPGSKIIDARGLTVLPGYIDTHVHLTLAGLPRDNAAKTLEAGFTTVLDLGSANGAAVRVRRRIDADSVRGPRVIAAGSWIGGRGGVCDFGGATIRGAEEARQRALADLQNGAQFIKLCLTNWLSVAVTNPDSAEMSTAEISAVTSVARAANVPVAAHAIGAAGVRQALDADVRLLAHTPVVDEATARRIARANVCVSTTMTTLLANDATGDLRRSFQRLRTVGVKFVLGTDAGVLPHGSNAQELATLVNLGLDRLAALRAATVDAAECLGIPNYGEFSIGAAADFVLVEGDPLTGASWPVAPRIVVKAGRVVHEK